MKLLISILLLTSSCSTLAPIFGGAAGAAAGSLGGPATAALGGGAGVAVAQMAYPNNDAPVSDAVALAAANSGKPAPGTAASTIYETKSLIFQLGWWYAAIFVLVPLVTKRGRKWIKKFGDIGNTVSQKDIDTRDEAQDVEIKELKKAIEFLQETKKEVALQNERLNNLESMTKTATKTTRRLLTEENKS